VLRNDEDMRHVMSRLWCTHHTHGQTVVSWQSPHQDAICDRSCSSRGAAGRHRRRARGAACRNRISRTRDDMTSTRREVMAWVWRWAQLLAHHAHARLCSRHGYHTIYHTPTRDTRRAHIRAHNTRRVTTPATRHRQTLTLTCANGRRIHTCLFVCRRCANIHIQRNNIILEYTHKRTKNPFRRLMIRFSHKSSKFTSVRFGYKKRSHRVSAWRP